MKNFLGKNTGGILISVGIAVIVIVMVFGNKLFGKTPSNNEDITSGSFPLKYGSRGSEVSSLQQYLNKTYGEALVVDGIFGVLTQGATERRLGVQEVSKQLFDSKKM